MNKIMKNYFYSLLYQVLTLITPIVMIPYKARVLGASNIGIYSYVYSVFSYIVMIGSIGINMYGKREISYVKNDISRKSKVFYELLILKFITMVLSITVFFIFIGFKSSYSLFYFIMLFDMVINIFDLSWFFHGIEEFKKISIISIIVKILNVIAIFLFVKTRNDLVSYFLITTIFDSLLIVLSIIFIPKNLVGVKISELRPFGHFKMCLLLFIPQIFHQIYTVCDKIMLGNLANNISEVGFYEYSNKIVKISLCVISTLVVVMIPTISNEFARKNMEKVNYFMNKAICFVLLIGIPLMIGIVAISSNLVVVVFGSEYLKMIPLIRLMSLVIVSCGITTVIGEQYLVSTRQEKKFTFYVMIGAMTNVILNLLLIPHFQSFGASLATVITETIILFIELPIIRKFVDRVLIKLFFKYLLFSLIMGICVYIVGIFFCCMLGLAAQVIVGVVVYFLIIYISGDEMIDSFRLR